MTSHASAEQVHKQIASVLAAWGMPADLIATTVEVMVETDLMGVDSHGVSMLMLYEEKLKEGRLRIKERPLIVRQTAVTALIDAGGGLGHPASVMGMRLAVEKAAEAGVAVVSVTNSHHFGAAGYYARLALPRGLIGMVASSTRGITVVPTGGVEPVLGTNPLAFAAPTRRNPPFVLDMATSTVAAGKVKVYGFQGKPLPDGWVVDAEGRAVTDANFAYETLFGRDRGGLTPIGGTPELASHKGYGLGLMVHILGGVLAAASFTPLRKGTEAADEPENIGHFFMAIDPNTLRPDGRFEDDLDDVIDRLRATVPADPGKPVLIAGDPEAAKRSQRLKDGIPIPDALERQLRAVCDRAGVPYMLG